MVFGFLSQTVEKDLIYFGERNSVNIGAAFVNSRTSQHEIGQTYEGVFVIFFFNGI